MQKFSRFQDGDAGDRDRQFSLIGGGKEQFRSDLGATTPGQQRQRADFTNIRTETDQWTREFVKTNSTSTPVETLADEIQKHLDTILKEHVPTKFSSTRFNQPWLNTTTKRSCRRKARAYKKARKTKKDRDWLRFRRLKKETQTACRQAYNTYLKNIVCSEPGGNKRLGALIKSKRCDRTGVSPLKDGNFLKRKKKKQANILNQQFANVFTDDSSAELPDLGPASCAPISKIHVNCHGVAKLLRNLKPHKASGPDGVPAKLLKEVAEEIAPAVTLLFQASLDQGTVPSTWKEAVIVPIFKKGDRSSAANYRPISLTNILCKLCEHIVNCAIMDHLTEYNILSDAQCRFQKEEVLRYPADSDTA
ncbi:uncharacterized protein [Amphiura filiformis]|uniref:uncharacterized protein n=1 Tax=Amphiura filiformis TaxID=82378 RepID=UPI003B216217